ncbi:carbohydrate ABC transporter permease [Paenibacillus sp. IB182496]|uniref:Carbohydrate ABC transporter permease n=1 Tax=Paenibacillus sabuli TaxID=2772509 RepID=A0A927GTP8_9BACL|nr:carbohydrate ABC transporter permease [Paenibacillus sabuli]MBD2848084.1 carbohydrate ABC transporter permease [Paenibacillus sabuli]
MRDSPGEKLFYACNYAVLTVLALTCLLPLLNIAALSLSDSTAVLSGKVSVYPIGLTWKSYATLLEASDIVRAFANSVVLTVVGVALCLLFTLLAAYPLSRRGFYARRPATLAIVFTMLFSGGLIPTYLVVNGLGLVDSYGAIWLPGLISVYNMLIMKTHFENMPDELEEAARIDGAGEWTFITRVVLPLSLPMLATIGLFYGVAFWNAFMNVLIYINDPMKYNLMVLVQNMIRSQSMLQSLNNLQPEDLLLVTPAGVKSAGMMVLIVPLLAVYPFLQKYFVKGAMIGAIKG